MSPSPSPSPTVLHPLTLPALLEHMLVSQTAIPCTHLIVCSSRDLFVQDVAEALQHDQAEGRASTLHDQLTPTLFHLSTAQRVKLAFCPSVQTLLAYLTAYGQPSAGSGAAPRPRERLVLVNPLALHASTSSFSAQGLSRTFAAAVDTALRLDACLVTVECMGQRRGLREEDADMELGDGYSQPEVQAVDPWEQEVSLLNISARRYGSGSERAWAGRTVTTRRIAERWFCFERVEG